MYLLIAWVWFLFAARCAFFYLLFISGFISAFFFFFLLFLWSTRSSSRKLPNTCTKQGKNCGNEQGLGDRKGQAELKRNAKCDSPHALYD